MLSRQMLSRQYLLCIQPCIDYAISVWRKCSKQLKDMITNLQHRADYIVIGIFDFINFCGAYFKEILRWHSFNNQMDYFTANMMFKCINGLVPLCLINKLNVTSDAHSANTRASSNGNILVPIAHVKKFRNSFEYRGAVLWNTLIYRKHRTLMNLNTNTVNIISPKETEISHTFISWFYDITMVISTAFL